MSASALALSAGCATVSKEEALSGLVPPGGWASQNLTSASNAEAGLPLNWVETFNDPALTGLIAEAMNKNNDLGAAATRVEIARQSAVASRAGLLPTLSTSIDYSKRDSSNSTAGFDTNGVPIPGGVIEGYGLGINAGWEPDIWGRLTDNTRSSYKLTKAVEADFSAARLSIAGAVARSWYLLMEARLQRELSERDVESGTANLNITERRYQRGVSSSLDVRLARSSLASSKAALIARRQAEQETTRGLEVLLGRFPANEVKTSESLPLIKPLTAGDGSVIGLGTPANLLDRRPDLVAASNRLTAAGLDARVAKKALLPRLNIGGSLSTNALDFNDIFDLDEAVETLFAGLAQPIFQGGRLRANAKAQQAAADGAVYTYVGTVLNAYREVENTISAEELIDARVQAQKLAFEEAVAAEDLTEQQYLAGTRTIFNLIDAQQRRIRSESSYISAQRDQLINRVDLFMALGGTFDVGSEQMAAIAAGQTGGKPSLFSSNKQEGDGKTPLFKRWWWQKEAQNEASGEEK